MKRLLCAKAGWQIDRNHVVEKNEQTIIRNDIGGIMGIVSHRSFGA